MATHKELSNFTHDRLSKCDHVSLEIAEFKASLNVILSQAIEIFENIKNLL